jgi:hypothetical protein
MKSNMSNENSLYFIVCSAGTYGVNCNKTCNCTESNVCDPETGECVSRKYPGTGECVSRKYQGTGVCVSRKYQGTGVCVSRKYPEIGEYLT